MVNVVSRLAGRPYKCKENPQGYKKKHDTIVLSDNHLWAVIPDCPCFPPPLSFLKPFTLIRPQKNQADCSGDNIYHVNVQLLGEGMETNTG